MPQKQFTCRLNLQLDFPVIVEDSEEKDYPFTAYVDNQCYDLYAGKTEDEALMIVRQSVLQSLLDWIPEPERENYYKQIGNIEEAAKKHTQIIHGRFNE